MTDTRNVQIPLTLFMKIMSFFDYLHIKDYAFPSICDFESIYAETRAKQHKLNLHTAYTNSLIAKDESQRHLAYANYQKLKNRR